MFSERWVSALLGVTFEGLLVHDGTTITDANDRVAQMFGYDDGAALVGLPYDVILSSEGRRQTAPRVAGALEGRYRTECRHRDGSVFSLNVNAREFTYNGARARIVAFCSPSDCEPGLDPLIERANALDATVRALAQTIEQRDTSTAGHQDRVCRLAVQVADRLAVDGATLDTVRMAASVHDIGKIAIPAEILMKPAALTEDEFQLVKGHARAGYRILESIDFRGPVALAVLQHHERLDGTGYPDAIADPICEARILAVVDVYDALTSPRPYRAGLTPEGAVALMSDGEAGRLDAEVLRHLAATVL